MQVPSLHPFTKQVSDEVNVKTTLALGRDTPTNISSSTAAQRTRRSGEVFAARKKQKGISDTDYRHPSEHKSTSTTAGVCKAIGWAKTKHAQLAQPVFTKQEKSADEKGLKIVVKLLTPSLVNTFETNQFGRSHFTRTKERDTEFPVERAAKEFLTYV